MKRTIFPTSEIFLFLLLLFVNPVHGLSNVYGQTDIHLGIQPLLELGDQSVQALIPESLRHLVVVKEIERFLQELEGMPPDWTQLRHSNLTEQSERLFQLNRQRDEARNPQHSLLHQPIAFLWSGMLRQYLPEYQGFSLALGPELTPTSWGIIRFKPRELPSYIVAVPSPVLRKQLLTRQQQGEQIEIIVVFIGTLTPDESLIYAFSHDGHKEGMILPVVFVQNIMYILKTS
jgi:hypothetical protein